MSRDRVPGSATSGYTALGLLCVACELAGGEESLAQRLQVAPELLKRYMAGVEELPPRLLLRMVDVVQEETELRLASPGEAAQARGDGDDRDRRA